MGKCELHKEKRDVFERGKQEVNEGGTKSYGQIEAGKMQRQQTRPGAVWVIQDAESEKPLGFFRVGDRTARALIPNNAKQNQ